VSLRHGSLGGKAPVHSQPRHREGSATWPTCYRSQGWFQWYR